MYSLSNVNLHRENWKAVCSSLAKKGCLLARMAMKILILVYSRGLSFTFHLDMWLLFLSWISLIRV